MNGNPKQILATKRAQIAARVRALRQERKLSQAELAVQLGLSQNRLSEIERGAGSFSAEQLLLILALFNITTTEFSEEVADPEASLQNALARLGATHLHESDKLLPSERLAEVNEVIREVLVSGAPRLVTAAAPTLVLHARTLNLRKIQADLQRLGIESRLPWLVDNTLAGFELLNAETSTAKTMSNYERQRRYRRLIPAFATLQLFSNHMHHAHRTKESTDILDPSIRTTRTFDATRRKSSPISQRWGIVTALKPEDFVEPLRALLESD